MSQDNITRHNHYVPEWYQKQFLVDGKSYLHLLDLKPDTIKRPDGSPVIDKNGYPKMHNAKRNKPPSQCFQKFDLYTTRMFGKPNDAIEKWLFGAIDNRASRLLPTFIKEDWQALTPGGYQTIFAYIDAQRLRTPAGLDFIKLLGLTKYKQLFGQELLMKMMQASRTMHLTMWAECVQEIVSAEDSDIKFIITDHPVTFYNYKAFPGSNYCQYPADPPLHWQGTQTLFVTDPNHCMIFTHLDFAKNPDTTNPFKDRINGRYFEQTIERMDSWIRTRKLKREEVSVINHILKTRARRYIAAGKEEWLYPEETAHMTHWSKLRKITLPKDEVYMFGGEMFVGYEDGTVYQQDAYGRQTMSQAEAQEQVAKMKKQLNEILAREKSKTDVTSE